MVSAPDFNTVSTVPTNDVPFLRHRTAYDVMFGPVTETHACMVIPKLGGAADICANEVADDHIVVSANIPNPNANEAVAANDISLSDRSSPNGVGLSTTTNIYTHPGIPQAHRTVHVSTDAVATDGVAHGAGALDHDAPIAIAADEVALARASPTRGRIDPTDEVVTGSIADVDAVLGVADSGRAAGIRANEISDDSVVYSVTITGFVVIDMHTMILIPTDDVTVGRCVTADNVVVGTINNDDSPILIGHAGCPCGIGTDQVPDNTIVVTRMDLDAVTGIPTEQIALDCATVGLVYTYAFVPVADRCNAGDIGADVVADNQMIGSTQFNTIVTIATDQIPLTGCCSAHPVVLTAYANTI